MTRSGGWRSLVGGLVVLPLVALVPTPVASAAPACVLRGTGMVDHQWVGGDGDWSDPSHWSTGVVPGTATSDDYVCVGRGVTVTVDAAVISTLLVTAFELGRGSTLALDPGTALLVTGDQATRPSVIRLGSVVDVRGATLGGPGLIHVRGDVRVQSTATSPGRLSTALDGDSGDASSGGRMLVGDDGTLDVTGSADVLLSWGYAVEVHGRARLLDTAALVADHGTTFSLEPHQSGDQGVGRLVLRNDRGYLEGPARGELPLSQVINRGRIVKRASAGNSVVSAAYSGDGEVRIRSGSLVLPDDAALPTTVEPGASLGSGSCVDVRVCGSDTSVEDPQFASLKLPDTAGDSAQVVITPLDREAAKGLGVPVKVHALGLDVTTADPAVIELRYDASLLADAGRPANPDRIRVAHKDGRRGSYHIVPACLGAAALIPTGSVACVDRRPGLAWSSRLDGKDVIMVVRTTDTSRWIAL